MQNLLMNNGDGAAVCRLADVFAVNDFTLEERDAVFADLEARGFHAGGGGAAGTWYIGTEAGLRVAMGREIAATLKQWLTADQWAACNAGTAEPPQFCDDNEATLAAFVEVFGGEFMPGEATPEAAARQAVALTRANGALRLSSVLARGAEVTDTEALALVKDDDTRGLNCTVTRYTLPEMRAAIAAVWS